MRLFGSVMGTGLFFLLGQNEPNIIEKVDMLFKDVEVEGKKLGYEKAAKEYGKAFRAIKKEYKDTKQLIEEQKKSYDTKSEDLILKLEILEKEKGKLEKEIKRKIKDVSAKYDVSVEDVTHSVACGALLVGGPVILDVLGIIYSHKEKKLREAEQRGYIEAKKLYEEKIEKLKKDLKELKNKGNKEISELIEMINKILDDIADEQMKIAELKILL